MKKTSIGIIMLACILQGVTIATQDIKNNRTAYFAGGCFWCMEPPFEKQNGIKEVVAGYMGGTTKNPTYKTYANGGHIETIAIEYDPSKVSYPELLEIFWRNIDPTDAGGQFGDRGPSYRSVIFYMNDEEKKEAERSKAQLATSGKFKKPIVTEILKASTFYPAEEYHQDYYKENPLRYKWYRYRSGRDAFLEKYWKDDATSFKKPSKKELQKKLTPIEYYVTQEDGTEKAFDNAYWDNKEPGIYVDILSGKPLFSSADKYTSGTGWPSFTQPISKSAIVEKKEWFGLGRTEIRSKLGDNHLGHVFNDGPPPTGLRYCMNSAALRFIPKKDMEKEGYEKYISQL